MGVTGTMKIGEKIGRASPAGIASVVVLCGLSAISIAVGLWKLFIISWVAFVAMAGGAALGAHAVTTNADRLVWGYGVASGAMITSAALFLIPQAVGFSPKLAGIGTAIGVLVGFGSHTMGHRLSHHEQFESVAVQLSAHSLAAGAIMGLVYSALPDLGLLLGLSIVSHKGPAGYAAARRLARENRVSVLLLPAAGVGIAALPVALLGFPASQPINAIVFGFATGIFLHVAMDFLPDCETGGEISDAIGYEESDDVHSELDRLRIHSVVSTFVGGGIVTLGWSVLAL